MLIETKKFIERLIDYYSKNELHIYDMNNGEAKYFPFLGCDIGNRIALRTTQSTFIIVSLVDKSDTTNSANVLEIKGLV